jgi:hypothetical protein
MKSKKILVVGCSWSAGVASETENWVHELSKIRLDHTFYNLSRGGTSIQFHLGVLEKAKEKLNPDITIFQYTSAGRLTWWEDFDIMQYIDQDSENYYTLSHALCSKVDQINIGTIYGNKFIKTDRAKHKFGKLYYNRVGFEAMKIELKVYIDYAKKVSDFQFHHKSSPHVGENELSVQEYLGDKKFNKFTIDDGAHFGDAGNKWQAQWINEHLIAKGLL